MRGKTPKPCSGPRERALRVAMSSAPCSKSIALPTTSPCVSRRERNKTLLVGQGETPLAGQLAAIHPGHALPFGVDFALPTTGGSRCLRKRIRCACGKRRGCARSFHETTRIDSCGTSDELCRRAATYPGNGAECKDAIRADTGAKRSRRLEISRGTGMEATFLG